MKLMTVLVHGAFAGSASCNGVTSVLHNTGHRGAAITSAARDAPGATTPHLLEKNSGATLRENFDDVPLADRRERTASNADE